MSDMKQIGVVGGGGTIGRLVTRYFTELGYEVFVSDPSLPDSLSLEALLDQVKTVYISVFPMEIIPQILDTIAQRPDASDFVILENGSIKDLLADSFHKLDTAGASLCATHPLCKADQPWKNQNVLLIPYGENGAVAHTLALELYEYAEMNVHQVDSLEDHDELMCLLQLVPHLILRLVANLFAELETDLDLLNSAATANFKLFYLSLWRVLVQSPDLSAEIIGRLMDQPRGREIYHRFASALSNVPLSDISTLTDLFRGFYDTTAPSKPYMNKMNMQGIVTLERLANLERRSLSILTEKDEVGMLREILRPFEELGINISAIDSHLTDGTLRFDIGYDSGVSAESLAALKVQIESMGHRVEQA